MKRKASRQLVSAHSKQPVFRVRAPLTPTQSMQIETNRAAATLRRAAAMQRLPLQRASPQEKNYDDLTNTGYVCDTTGTVTLVNSIAQGAGVNERIGKKAMLRSLQIRGHLVAAAAGTVIKASILIVYDKRPTGSLPAITDILVTASSFSFNNDNNSGRFQILRRMDFEVIGNNTTPTTGREAFAIDEFIKINRPIVFKSAGTGAIGDIEEGAVYAVTVGSAATNAPTAALGYRTRFTEV